MKLVIVLCLVAVAFAAPQRDIQIDEYNNNNDGLGQYSWNYRQNNGQRHNEEGQLKNAGREDESLEVKGEYSWVGPDGVTYIIRYIANENGFQPEIEQGPGGGVPPAVVASLLG